MGARWRAEGWSRGMHSLGYGLVVLKPEGCASTLQGDLEEFYATDAKSRPLYRTEELPVDAERKMKSQRGTVGVRVRFHGCCSGRKCLIADSLLRCPAAVRAAGGGGSRDHSTRDFDSSVGMHSSNSELFTLKITSRTFASFIICIGLYFQPKLSIT
ncbi:uncharacterized protein BDZ99DRAFT_125523 [Mytilinidion resinicola]|uniref:Uncharacterized protein n=1 Tax=Mytilinidion resinicola TaxID=574789 RepID=A0A6A6Z440_9PEZI|nr:uncharacterized protein BDZ99DRAFT_125523 [Mytilinidion resinicola]KAF2815911.1 hypothetical protein BDZ99DRAFT_125523 [Mytilinidion resinicola]